MLVWPLLWTAIAQAACPDLVPVKDQDEPYRVDVKHTFTSKDAGCSHLTIAKVSRLRIEDFKAVLRAWDDTRTTFGEERLGRVEGAWVLDVPELREGDELRLRLQAVPTAEASDTSSAALLSLGLPQRILVDWAGPAQNVVFGPGGNVSRAVTHMWEGTYSAGVHQVWAPAGATTLRCSATIGGQALEVRLSDHGCGFELAEKGQGSVALGWNETGVGPSGEWDLAEGQALELKDVHAEHVGLTPAEEGLVFVGPGHVSLVLSRLGDTPVEKVALREVSEAAKLVSIPEPGLGLSFKGRMGGMEMVAEVLALVREQVQNGHLSGSHPLKARPLMKVRKSGWATPWEQALLLTRYLGQLKIPATAYPVRPRPSGLAVEGAPDGYVDAVVRAGSGEEAVWIDPSCRVCTIGEMDPDLWGGQVFSADLKALPDGTDGRVSSRLEDGKIRVELDGPAALRLRIWLLPVAMSERGTLAAELFAGPGATLVEHQGFSDLGEPIRLLIQP